MVYMLVLSRLCCSGECVGASSFSAGFARIHAMVCAASRAAVRGGDACAAVLGASPVW
jgi:hypothetical protein